MLNNKTFAVFILFLLALAPAGWGQNRFAGTVRDAATKAPLAGVEVFLPAPGLTTMTNANGRFELKGLPSGSYSCYIFLFGYQTLETSLTLAEGNQEGEFLLTDLQVRLAEVVVQEAQEDIYALQRLKAVEGTAIYAGKKTEVILLDLLTANMAANNARQIYGQVSGLNIQEADDGGLQLNIGGRGLDPNRSASFNTRQNGYDISADVLGYPESYYTPPAEALHEVQIIRGAASLQYGTQFGGLVNFVFRQPAEQQKISGLTRQTYGSNNLFTSFNSLSGTVGKFSYYTYFNHKQGDGFRPNSGFKSQNAYLHLGYQATERTQLTAEITYLDYLAQQAGGLTDARFYTDPTFSNRTRNWFDVDWLLYALRLEHRFSVKTELSVQLFGLDASRRAVGFRTNRVSQVDDLAAPRDLLIGEFNNWGAEARLLTRYAARGRDAVFLVGVKWYDSDNRAVQGPGSAAAAADFQLATGQFPSYDAQSDFRFPNQNLALFAENIFYLSERFSLTPGIRYEYIHTRSEGIFRAIDRDLAGNPIRDQQFTDNRSFPRHIVLLGLGLSYKPLPAHEFYANFSQNFRSVTFADIRVTNPSDQVDPNISDERGFTADLGWRTRQDRFTLELTGFGLLYDDRLGQVLRPRTRVTAEGQTVEVNGPPVRWRGNIGRAFITGFESMLDWQVLHAAATDQKSTFRLNYFINLALTHSNYFASEVPNVKGKEVEFIPQVNLKTGLRFGYHNLLGSVQYTYLSEQFSDATNAPQDQQDNLSGIVGSIPAYHIVDLSLSYQIRKGLKVETGVNNALNSSYFTRRATGYPGPGIIPSAPRTGYLTVALAF
ncbi:MAG: TonB-dependent receptor [Bacteroidetes bacterium]|nr:MAG: TonB-dependent receptor [Bacteroidota bacterium]PTM12662.1 MAG: TonB-dependent receptor [Bacteroidota bacterium]